MPNFIDSVSTAENEARRFLRRIKQWRDETCSDNGPSKQKAAVKRASMDLSMALTDLRKGNTYGNS